MPRSKGVENGVCTRVCVCACVWFAILNVMGQGRLLEKVPIKQRLGRNEK